jgi:hypothetical protein
VAWRCRAWFSRISCSIRLGQDEVADDRPRALDLAGFAGRGLSVWLPCMLSCGLKQDKLENKIVGDIEWIPKCLWVYTLAKLMLTFTACRV